MTFKVLWFFIRVEIFKLVLIVSSIFITIIRLIVTSGLTSKVFRTFFLFIFLFFHDLGVGVLLKHESMSSLKGSSFDVFGGLWEQVAKLTKNVFRDTHEDDIGKLFSLILALVVWGVSKSFENQIRLKVIQDLIISEVRIFRQVKNWLLLVDFVIFIVENFN